MYNYNQCREKEVILLWEGPLWEVPLYYAITIARREAIFSQLYTQLFK